jgi:hypothetical protein
MRTLSRTLAVAAAGLTLSGCLSLGSVDKRGTAIDESIGTLQNRTILINLARASKGEPLYFISPGAVSGSMTTDLKLGNPAFLEGPAGLHNDVAAQLTFGSGSNIFDNSTQTSLAVSLDATKDFYTGIMQPLGLNDVDLLLHQGFSRELVYYIVIDHAKFTRIDPASGERLDKNGKAADAPGTTPYSFVVYNDPRLNQYPFLPPTLGYKPTFAAFPFVMQLAMETGFTTEAPQGGSASDCSGQKADSNKGPGANTDCGPPPGPQEIAGIPAAANGPSQTKGGVNFVLQEPASKAPGARLCFERDMTTDEGEKLLSTAEGDMGSASNKSRPIFCGEMGNVKGNKQYVELPCPSVSPSGVIQPDADGRFALAPCPSVFKQYYEIEIYTRSIYGIFTYLGEIMRQPQLTPSLNDYGVPGEVTQPGQILTVSSHVEPTCFTAVRYDNEQYCVPREGAPNTLQLFNIMSALIALKSSPGDVPVSQTVLVGAAP